MSQVETSPPIVIARPVQGRPVSASGIGQIVDTVNALTKGMKPPQQVTPTPRAVSGGAIEVMKLVRVEGDYLVCKRDDDTEVKVAKPFRLRRTPFDGLDYNGVGYVYANGNERTATIAGSNRQQLERVIPAYVVDEEIEITASSGIDVKVADGTFETVDFLALYGPQGWKRATSRI